MLTKNQTGAVNVLIFPLIAVILLLAGAVAFGVWAYGGRQDYKNNTDAKINTAVNSAIKAEDVKNQAAYAQEAKKPLKTYDGPAAYGSLHISYPKTWSAYVIETGNGTADVDGYFQPNFVPNTAAQNNAFALRVQVVNQSYSSTLQALNNQVQTGDVTVSPYSLPSVKSIVGSRVKGAVTQGKNVDMVVLPLRDTTLEVWTEAQQFEDDFNNNILPNATFSP